MTPPGVHINKTAVAIISGLVVIIVLGFKYHKGSEAVVKTFNDQNPGESKQGVTTGNKPIMQNPGKREDWKTVDLETVKIPDEIEKKVKELKVVEKTYTIMGVDIFTRSVKPTVECKGGVLLLHGQAFTSKNWEEIKTLHYVAAMGYTPIAVDLPNYGQSEKKEVEDKGSFIEELLKVINFTKPVIISPSMSGSYSIPYLLKVAANADKKVSGYIPVAPVISEIYRDKVKDLKMPAALVYGENDKTEMRSLVEILLSKMPDSRLFKIKNAGHAAYLNQPDMWHKILYVFIRAAYHYN